MKSIYELSTPNFIVDLDILEQNIKKMGQWTQDHGKQLCPMVKTHKCTEICLMQQQFGYATSFLAGTLKEAEKMADVGIETIMLAYPQAGDANMKRIISLVKKAHIYVCFDGVENARLMQQALEAAKVHVDYVAIVDCGLHRLGVQTDEVAALVSHIADTCPNLHFQGITSHPGHVYGIPDTKGIAEVARHEIDVLTEAKAQLHAQGFPVRVVATGCTPTALYELKSQVVDVIRPGNYVFNDALQVALGVATVDECSLTVLATVTAHPAADRFIIDAGTKCFGLDKGAHNITLVNGFGIIKDHPELTLESLSEEVGKIKVHGQTSLKVGDVLQIIPNHACVVANMTGHLVGYRHDVVEKDLHIDARGGND